MALVGIISINDTFAQTESSVDKESDFQTYVLSFAYGEFYIPYKITGGNLTQINPSGHGSLEVHLETFKDGFLILNLPRKFLDTPDQQHKFIVLDTRESAFIELDYEENSTETNRILTIPISTDTEKIEILHRAWDVPKFTYEKSDYDYLFSPMKQIKNGVTPKDILCRNNLQLILKLSNYSPICVTAETTQKLFERGVVEAVILIYPYQTNRITQTNQTEWIELPKMQYSDAVFNSKLHKQLLIDYYKHKDVSVLDIRYNLVGGTLIGEACEGSYGIFSVEILIPKSDINKIKNIELKSYFQEIDPCKWSYQNRQSDDDNHSDQLNPNNGTYMGSLG